MHSPAPASPPPDGPAPTSTNSLDHALDTLPDHGEVVAYCRGTSCRYADDAIRALRSRGRRALRLEEGVPEWRRHGGIIEV